MGFSLYCQQKDGLTLSVIKDESTKTEIAILPGYGASLHFFAVQLHEKSFNIIDNYSTSEEIIEKLNTSYKSSKLSPFPCRIDQATYHHQGEQYVFAKKFIDGTAIHGLLFDKPFKVTNTFSDEKKAGIVLQYDYKKDDPGYPFEYKCTVEYVLEKENLLTLKTTITNETDVEIPIADGWHPYFCLGDEVNNWLMQFASVSIVEFNDNLIPTGRLLPYHEFNSFKKIDDIQLDNCFLLKKELPGPACTVFNPKNKLSVDFWVDESYPYLQIYIPPHRKSIAIENLSSAPDCFNNKMGLTLLRPGHSQTFTVQYQARIT